MRIMSRFLFLAGILLFAKASPFYSEMQNDEIPYIDGDEMENEDDNLGRGPTLLIGTRSAPSAIIETAARANFPVKTAIRTTKTQESCSIAYECQERRIVWNDLSGNSIRSAFRDGTDEKVIYSGTDAQKKPSAIAVDWSSKNVFFINWDKIDVVSMNGNYRKQLTSGQIVAELNALALDSKNRHVFFSKSVHRQGRSQEIIVRMDMDGSNLIDFHDTNGTSELIALVVLPKRSELCWVDKTIVQRHFVYKLWCIGLDQRDERLVYEHNDLSKLKILTVLNEERFYWTSDERGQINSISVTGEGASSYDLKDHEEDVLCGIVAVSEECPAQHQSECADNNGGCPYLCLPKTGGGATCICPDNVKNLDGCKMPEYWFF